MAEKVGQPPPLGWAADSLTDFIEIERTNQSATFANHTEVSRLIAIDGLFVRFLSDWVNPKPRTSAFFMFRCHSAFRGACSHVLATRCTEAFPLMRLGLELRVHSRYRYQMMWLAGECETTCWSKLSGKLSIVSFIFI